VRAKEYLSCYAIITEMIEKEQDSKKIAILLKKQSDIKNAIYALSPYINRVLYRRFIKGESLKVVSREIERSYDYTRHLCGKGLNQIEENNLRLKMVSKENFLGDI